MVIQVIVDHEYIFRDICVGWARSVQDARIFVNSINYRKITEENILNKAYNFV